MVLHALNRIANNFINQKVVDLQKAQDVFLKIKSELEIKQAYQFKKEKLNLDLKKHFEDIDEIRKYLKENFELTNHQIENKINYFLALFLPSQEELNNKFKNKKNYEYLKTLSLLSYYIKKDKNDKNLIWNHKTKYGNLKISINKAKPEKTIDEIKKFKDVKVSNANEPLCPICIENIGFSGSEIKDSRENLRVLFHEFKNGQKWFFQYSPYSYLKDHFVLNNINHIPMKVSNTSIENLLEFVDKNDNFFFGSNVDLPIVGGSLLGHDHYQGGSEPLPITKAKTLKKYNFLNATVNILDWPLNAVKITSKDKDLTYSVGCFFINTWKHEQFKNLVNKNNNSSTLICCKKNGIFNLIIIFRNNSVSQSRPYGNFHFHHDKFNIKQENIGLMEAAGLAILPQRLETELLEVARLAENNQIEKILESETLKKHYNWITSLIKSNKKINQETILNLASDVFLKGLEDCKVLDNKSFIKWIERLNKSLQDTEITNKNNLKIKVNGLGFTIKEILFDKNNFLLEYENKYSYLTNSIFLNSYVGPVAGRIQQGSLVIDNKIVDLPIDENKNYIHSMDFCLANTLFEINKKIDSQKNQIISGIKKFYYKEFDAFLTIKINLKLLNNQDKFYISYEIASDKQFIANPTQHFYFNLPNTKNIDSLILNINNNNKVFELSEYCNPKEIKLFDFKNEFNTIKNISKQLDSKQHKIINGYLDHPFLSKNENVILKNNDYQLTIKSTIKDFVIYTHNYPSKEKIKTELKKQKNLAVCIKHQNVPLSIWTNNVDKILYNNSNKYHNKLEITINKLR